MRRLTLLFLIYWISVSSLARAQNAGIYMAINALAGVDEFGNIYKRRIEIDWYGGEVLESDRIVITKPFNEVVAFSPWEYPDGVFVLPGNVPYPTLQEMGFTRTCVLGYNVTWNREDGSSIASNCLQSEPSWMWDHRTSLGQLPVGDLVLAGSHDAGAYRDYQGVGDDNWATSAVFAQEEDFLHQLIWGVRFLDVRAGFYPTTPERFWLVHGIIKTHPMAEGVEDVKTFLRNTQDIVIWEVNEFEQVWDEEAHAEFKELLISSFSSWLVTPGDLAWRTPLSEIWSRPDLAPGEGRIILTYNSNRYTDPEFFFPEVLERWGNKDVPSDLYNYINSEVLTNIIVALLTPRFLPTLHCLPQKVVFSRITN